MKGKKEEDRLIEEFAAARIAVWEVKHGLLSTQGRECINTIITCSIKADHHTLIECIKEGIEKSDTDKPRNLSTVIQQCYCEYLRDVEHETDSE